MRRDMPIVDYRAFVGTRRWADNLKEALPDFPWDDDEPTRSGYIYFDSLYIMSVTKDWPEDARKCGHWYLILNNDQYLSHDLGELQQKLYEWATGEFFQPLIATPHNVEQVQREFPDYDTKTLPLLAPGFTNTSWHNDVCPTWTEGESPRVLQATDLMIVADYPEPHRREHSAGAGKRFGVQMYDHTDNWSPIYSTDNGGEIAFVVAYARYVRKLGLGFHVDTRGSEYTEHPAHGRRLPGVRVFCDAEAAAYDFVVQQVSGFTDPYELAFGIWNVLGAFRPGGAPKAQPEDPKTVSSVDPEYASFTVELPRVGGFPMDMLRFDEAWPAGPDDAAMIDRLIRADDAEITQLSRLVRVQLWSARRGAPDVRRWDSFGVRVVQGGN